MPSAPAHKILTCKKKWVVRSGLGEREGHGDGKVKYGQSERFKRRKKEERGGGREIFGEFIV